ncbi:MAG: hypothetical protein LBK27_04545 [Treponema sp.]|jgi:hypothetical protein|nr:hypothetical protein [Treponema sp.]
MGTLRPALFLLSALCTLPGAPALRAQSPADAEVSLPAVLGADPGSLIGLSLENLLSRFGVPQAVYAARGNEAWQDDVVFVYGEADFYVFKDRVWQIRLKAAYGVKTGDPRPAVSLTLGEAAEEFADHIVLSLPSRGWPLALRINLDASGFVSAVYVYRPDF